MDEHNVVEQTAAEEKPVDEKPVEPATEEKPDHEDGEAGDTDGAHVPIREVQPAEPAQLEPEEKPAEPEDLGKSVDAAYPKETTEPTTEPPAPTFESEIAHVFQRVHADLGARVDAIEKAFSDRVEAIEKDFADYRQKIHDAGIRLVS